MIDMDDDQVILKTLVKIRKLADAYMKRHQMGSALFWSGQAKSLSKGNPDDVMRLAECLIIEKQYHRASHLLKSYNLDTSNLRGCYLAAKAAYESKELEEAVIIMEQAGSVIEVEKQSLPEYSKTNNQSNTPPITTPITSNTSNRGDKEKVAPYFAPQQDYREINSEKLAELRCTLGAIFLLRGRIEESLDNRASAADAFKEAVRIDVFCHEAFQALIKHQILTADEEQELLSSMQFDKQCEGETTEPDLFKFLHQMSLKKYDKPADLIVPKNLETSLSLNSDFAVAKAERHFYNCDYTQCFSMTSSVMKEDPFHTDCLPIHISCLVELKKPNDLFHLAHKLVELYPEWVVAWFAVGCYYYMVSKHDSARRYLSKATQLDRVFGPAWLAYGHSFALENEHDQAMAAYFKAFQLMKGCHLPLLYIGVEYGLTNNQKLAEQFFTQSLEIAPKDPFVLHELGVTCFQNQDYNGAERYFKSALQEVRKVHGSVLSSKWESLLNNLGHTSRKLEKYCDSLFYHQQALVLIPMSASTYSAIGYVQSLQGDLVEAVEAFHKALSLRRDDTFSTTMLNFVIEQLMVESPPYHDYPEDVPKLDPVQLDPPPISLPINTNFEQNMVCTIDKDTSNLSDSNKQAHIATNISNQFDESQSHRETNNSEMSIDIEMADISNNDRTFEQLASQHDE